MGLIFGRVPVNTAINAQGALSGGGWYITNAISDDGTTHIVNYDSSNAWIKSDGTWTNLLSQDRCPSAYSKWGKGADYLPNSLSAACGLDVCATDATRLWALVSTTDGRRVWRSDDGGASWNDTALTIPSSVSSARYVAGKRVFCDPNDPDTCYISDLAGVIFRTQDAGTTWTILNASGQPLAGILPAAASTTTVTSGTTLTFTATPSALIGLNFTNYHVAFTNIDNVVAFTNGATISASSSTTATINASYPISGSPGVTSGDVIVFGMAATVAFDRSSGTDANGRTNGVYIGWAWGADAIYYSSDAGGSFAPLNSGTYPSTSQKIECSSDGILYLVEFGGGYANTTATPCWKYDSGTWTNFSLTGGTGVGLNNYVGAAADPTTPGRVVFYQGAGDFVLSLDYGANFSHTSNFWYQRSAVDVPWLSPTSTLESSASQGGMLWDPVVSGKLWSAEGVGVWYCNPTYNGAGVNASYTWTSDNAGSQGLIVDHIVKFPGSNGLMVAVQDRAGLKLADVSTEPSGPQVGFGVLGAITHGTYVDYAKDNSGYCVIVIGDQIWESSDWGETWAAKSSQPTVTGYGGVISVQSSSNMVYFPANDGTPVYWDGSSWNDCLFAGSSLHTGWAFSFYLMRKNLVCDLSDTNTYYAYNYNNDSTGGFWVSTDGGANWTLKNGYLTFYNLNHTAQTGNQNFQMCAAPGNLGHVMISFGNAYGGGAVIRTVDATATTPTWAAVPGIASGWQVAMGAPNTGKTYPSVVFTGRCSTDTDTSDPGVFIADDMDPSNLSATPTWVRKCRAPAGNMDLPKGLCADPDVFGTFYLAEGSSGYVYGTS